jgi:prolipoprotein diacylglyceryltransferase
VVAFSLPGDFVVYAFSVLIGLGATTGLTWVAWKAPRNEALGQVNAGLWTLFGGLVGGRALYTGLNWNYFQSHFLESLQIFQGGISWAGALAGGMLALYLYARLARKSFGKLTDAMQPLAATLVVSAWLACWLDGCAYGPTVAWGGLPARDEWGSLSLRFPTQLLGAMLTLGMYWVLERNKAGFLRRRGFDRPGRTASLALAGLSVQFFGLSFLMVDPAVLWNGLRLGAWAALGFAVLGSLTLFVSFIRDSQTKQGDG